MPHGMPVIKTLIQSWTDACSKQNQQEGGGHMRGIHQPYKLSLYSKRVNEFETLPLKRERDLARRYMIGDVHAGQLIINANLRLSLKISKSYYHHALNPLDIIQEGNMGLVKALDMFDPEKGIRFSFHAVWWVHKYISDFLHKECGQKPGYHERPLSLKTALGSDDYEETFFSDHYQNWGGNQGEKYSALIRQTSISHILDTDNGPFNINEKYIMEGRFFGEPGPVPIPISRNMTIFKNHINLLEGEELAAIKDPGGPGFSQGKRDSMNANPIFTL
jgi:RNA polymerase sigma factor (sigma-70 family)